MTNALKATDRAAKDANIGITALVPLPDKPFLSERIFRKEMSPVVEASAIVGKVMRLQAEQLLNLPLDQRSKMATLRVHNIILESVMAMESVLALENKMLNPAATHNLKEFFDDKFISALAAGTAPKPEELKPSVQEIIEKNIIH